MEQHERLDAHVQAKRINNLLNEVLDLSRQLAEAMDREDRVTMQMLIGMRQEPIDGLLLADRALREQCEMLDDGGHLAALLAGAAPEDEAERGLADQLAANSRLYKQVMELDEVLNRKLGYEDSFYAT